VDMQMKTHRTEEGLFTEQRRLQLWLWHVQF
jgi:hypothetical protein